MLQVIFCILHFVKFAVGMPDTPAIYARVRLLKPGNYTAHNQQQQQKLPEQMRMSGLQMCKDSPPPTTQFDTS